MPLRALRFGFLLRYWSAPRRLELRVVGSISGSCVCWLGSTYLSSGK